MKLKNRRTTIISKLLGIFILINAMPALANTFGVSLKKENNVEIYFIETKVERINKARDNRLAPLYAKSQLLKHFKTQKKSASVDLKHFTLLNVKQFEGYSLFIFKVDKSNVVFNSPTFEK